MSFDPLFPKFAYFTESAINAPINFIDAYPSVTIQPTYNLAVMAGADVLWRYSRLDAFYSTFPGPIDPLVPGSANNNRFLGEQFYLHAEWYPTPHLDILAAWVHFQTAGFLAVAHGKNTDYIGVRTAYEF